MGKKRVVDTLLVLARKLADKDPAAFREFMERVGELKPEVETISTK